MFHGVQRILELMCSLDLCSMYPFVMAVLKGAYYPCGEIIGVDEYVKDKIGFYYCDIDQSNLKENNLPNIYPKKDYAIKADGTQGELIGNDWATTEILKDYMISSVMIEQLQKYGCGVIIKKGIIFTDKMRGCDLFEFILEFMMKKNEQDIYKKTKNGLYNGALRETIKLCVNSLSGKVIEGLHLEKTEMTTAYEFQQLVSRMGDDDDNEDDDEEIEIIKKSCRNKTDKANCKNDHTREIYYNKLLQNTLKKRKPKKKKQVESINAINFIGNNVFTSYKLSEEDEISKQKPIYLGVMVYDYSKCYIYDTLYAQVGLKDLVYTDTDAGKFRESKLRDVLPYLTNNEVPYWEKVLEYDERYKGHKLYDPNSKVFGSYEDEMDELPNNDMFYCFQKKSWVIIDRKAYLNRKPNFDGKETSFKMSFKGVPKNSIMLPLLENDGYDWLKKKYKKDSLDFELEIIDDKKCLDYYVNGTRIKDNLIEFCEELYDKKYIYVLTQNFKRVVKNNCRNVISLDDKDKFNIMNNTIQVQPIIKKITIH